MDLKIEFDSVWGRLANSASYERLETSRLATRTVCDPYGGGGGVRFCAPDTGAE